MSHAEANTNSDAFLRQRRFGRECALQFLYQVDQRQDWEIADGDLNAFWRQVEDQEDAPFGNDLNRARKFAEKIVRIFREHGAEIDESLQECASNWTLERMAAIDRNILRVAAVEIRFLENIPANATINEAVEIAKRYGDRDSAAFINGILDRFAQNSSQA
ncbi:MAG: transcription antitermination factor NusB [Verrucomicrobiota bacterium]